MRRLPSGRSSECLISPQPFYAIQASLLTRAMWPCLTQLSADVGAVLALLSEEQRLGLLGLCSEDGVSELDPSLAGISQGLRWEQRKAVRP